MERSSLISVQNFQIMRLLRPNLNLYVHLSPISKNLAIKKTSRRKADHFPHILRKITAYSLSSAREGFWLVLYTIVLVNLFSVALFDADTEHTLQNAILVTPFESSLHEKLAAWYLPTNLEFASREYKIAQSYYPQTAPPALQTVLGSQSPPEVTWQTIVAQKQNLEKEVLFWEQIRNIDPNYQYAWMKLGSMYIVLDRKKEAQILLSTLSRRIPFDTNVMELEKRL